MRGGKPQFTRGGGWIAAALVLAWLDHQFPSITATLLCFAWALLVLRILKLNVDQYQKISLVKMFLNCGVFYTFLQKLINSWVSFRFQKTIIVVEILIENTVSRWMDKTLILRAEVCSFFEALDFFFIISSPLWRIGDIKTPLVAR